MGPNVKIQIFHQFLRKLFKIIRFGIKMLHSGTWSIFQFRKNCIDWARCQNTTFFYPFKIKLVKIGRYWFKNVTFWHVVHFSNGHKLNRLDSASKCKKYFDRCSMKFDRIKMATWRVTKRLNAGAVAPIGAGAEMQIAAAVNWIQPRGWAKVK